MALSRISHRSWSLAKTLARFNHTSSTANSQIPKTFSAVQTQLNFFDPVAQEPNTFQWAPGRQALRPPNFAKPDTHDVTIRDLRGLSGEELSILGLDFENAGFQFENGWGPDGETIGTQWAKHAWKDAKWVETEYYAHVEKYVPSGCAIATISLY